MRLPSAIAVTLLAISATSAHAEAPTDCHGFSRCTRAFQVTGKCEAAPDPVLLQTAWEGRSIAIRAVTVGLQVTGWRLHHVLLGLKPEGAAFAGNGYQPDVMALQIGNGTTTRTWSREDAFRLPAKGQFGHVDLHVSCWHGYSYSAWMIVEYDIDTRYNIDTRP